MTAVCIYKRAHKMDSFQGLGISLLTMSYTQYFIKHYCP